jgi:UDP-N-acetylmuramoyl-L-alanyl-D-glutamate--2,6-diaminopimelate ligase
MEKLLRFIERLIPSSLYRFFQPGYHFLLAALGAVMYRFPSQQIAVIFVTGTKGKSSVVEILNSILEAAGEHTAILGTIRFKIDRRSERNLRKMTIPGRFFVQKFLRDAVKAKCSYAIIEMTSEGAKQFRHRFIDQDMLIFTNLSPEHIESHGSLEKYREAKLSIGRALAHSPKPHKYMVANADDDVGRMFLALPGVEPVPYAAKDGAPIITTKDSVEVMFRGTRLVSPLFGHFNALNILAAATAAHALGISMDAILRGVSNMAVIPGRGEKILGGQPFPVIVDYAHTPDSLRALYGAFSETHNICVLGNTGGGRDTWKRPVMAGIAAEHCAEIILTNEDPYDEDPRAILEAMEKGLVEKGHKQYEIILDRREAIARAIKLGKEAGAHSVVLITGKGTDPCIMGPKGSRLEWDDRRVAKEEIEKVYRLT